MNTATVFSFLVFLVITGWLWFYIVRPILEDFGIIGGEAVNDNAPAPTRVMSRSENSGLVSSPSSLETDNRQTTDRPAPALPSRDVMLNTFKLLRKYGVPREEARPIVKALGLPLDNNLWADAAPPEEETVHRTPIVGRPTSAKFESDPDYPFEPCRT